MLSWNPDEIRNPRRFGQHFLIDRSVLNRIVEHAILKKNETILEVGAGTGNLTTVLQSRAGKVVARKSPQLTRRSFSSRQLEMIG